MSLLTITASAYNGEFITPKDYVLSCNDVKPLEEALIRNFDENACIVVKKMFLIQVGGLDIIGTTQFKTKDDFYNYKNNQCKPCISDCTIQINSCFFLINGCCVTINNL